MDRLQMQRDSTPDLIVDVMIYPTDAGGPKTAIQPGRMLPCMSSLETKAGWDCLPLLKDIPLQPGEARRLGLVFLSGQTAVENLTKAQKFYFYDGRLIGEATPVLPT